MLKKSGITLISLFCVKMLFSQGIAANVGYDYIGKNAAYVGLDYRINEPSIYNTGKNIGVGTYLTFVNGKVQLIPVAHYMHSLGKEIWEANLAVSTKNVSPSLGANVFNGMALNLGYNFAYQDNSFRGPFIGFHLMLGGKSFYDKMKFF